MAYKVLQDLIVIRRPERTGQYMGMDGEGSDKAPKSLLTTFFNLPRIIFDEKGEEGHLNRETHRY